MTRSCFALVRQQVLACLVPSAVLLITACAADPSAPVQSSAVGLAARQSVSTDVTVTSATPDSATQDTTLDVVVAGTGFVSGSTATWALAGVPDPTQVRTNSTRYVSSRKLVANITISATAAIGKWDVIVMAGSKGGIGTEAFAIKTKRDADTNSRVNYVVANQVDLAPAGITGDGRLRDGTSANGADSEYQSRFCAATGSIANMLQPNGAPGTGDLFFDPGDGSVPCGARRYFVANLDGVATQIAPDSRAAAIWSISVGQAVTIAFSMDTRTYATDPGITNCVVLEFDARYGGDNIRVTRLDDGLAPPRKWLLKSQGSHRAACANPTRKGFVASGKTYYLPFAITLTEVPYPPPHYP